MSELSDAAIEAAANWLPHSGDCEVRPERDCTCYQPRVAIMRAALEAAAPYLIREARAAELEAAADAIPDSVYTATVNAILRDRAAAIRAGEA